MPHIGCAQVLLGPKGLPAKGKAAEEAKQKLLEVCGEEGGRGVQGSGACRQGCGGCRGVGVWEVCRAVGCVGGGIPPGGACGAQPPRPASRPALRLGGPLPAIHKRLVPALSGPAASAAACIRASDARAPPPPPAPPPPLPLMQQYKWATAAVASYSFVLGDDQYQSMCPVWDVSPRG
jgi:hypothetical protein